MPARVSAIGLAVVVLSACGGSGSAQETASVTGDNSAGTSAVPQRPPGGPAPEELEGTWVQVSPKGEGPVATLELTGQSYHVSAAASAGLPNGAMAVNGNEIAFFSTATCELFLPEGVGHYRWKVSGDKLHLDAIGKDPCSVRDPFFEHAVYKRTD
jgi:hypothetical protein